LRVLPHLGLQRAQIGHDDDPAHLFLAQIDRAVQRQIFRAKLRSILPPFRHGLRRFRVPAAVFRKDRAPAIV
jgi:hypothetical protein